MINNMCEKNVQLILKVTKYIIIFKNQKFVRLELIIFCKKSISFCFYQWYTQFKNLIKDVN